MTSRQRVALALVGVALVAGVVAFALDPDDDPEVGCALIDCPASSTTASSNPGASPSTQGPPARYQLVKIATLNEPVAVARIPGSKALAFAEKKGRVIVVDATGGTTTALDIKSQVATGNEQGLLGIALNPKGDRLYLNLTNRDGDTEIREYRWSGTKADTGSMRLLLKINQPYSNHNGGQIGFGPDGYLYIATGDGGSAGDPKGNAQRLDTLLGKLLRIDPSADVPYGIPGDNPFAKRAGARPEIWATGLRNPWRFTWHDDDLWIADVGQGDWEEIDRIPAKVAGANFGWDRLEGTHRFEGSAPAGAVAPVFEYDHSGGRCSVTGGDFLDGSYVFADYCGGRLQALRGDPLAAIDLDLKVDRPTSFGLDADQQLLVLSQSGPVYRVVRRD